MASTSDTTPLDEHNWDQELISTIFLHFTDESISPVCWFPRKGHKISLAYDHDMTEVRNNHMTLQYDVRYAPMLQRMGLWHVSQLAPVIANASLTSALVERWRPKTHTFHLPIREITVSLQDVSCLWGLPITGDAVTGVEYGDFAQLVTNLLGEELMKRRKTKNSMIDSKNDICIVALRQRFNEELAEHADPAEVARWTRSYIMDMFACWMFPDSSGGTVPASLLQFLVDLENPQNMNWGAAVLACLYRSLCNACQVTKKRFYGPIGLLHHWSWTRFPFGRPSPLVKDWAPDWGELDGQTCPAYAQRWCSEKYFYRTPHGRPTGVMSTPYSDPIMSPPAQFHHFALWN